MPDSPQAVWADEEQVAQVAAFLRMIGLTEGFAPLVLILGLTGWTGIYRLVRAEFMKHAARDYVRAGERLLDPGEAPRLLEPGARVRHPVFGPGTVIGTDTEQGAYLIRFDSVPTPRALSFRTRLEPCADPAPQP